MEVQFPAKRSGLALVARFALFAFVALPISLVIGATNANAQRELTCLVVLNPSNEFVGLDVSKNNELNLPVTDSETCFHAIRVMSLLSTAFFRSYGVETSIARWEIGRAIFSVADRPSLECDYHFERAAFDRLAASDLAYLQALTPENPNEVPSPRLNRNLLENRFERLLNDVVTVECGAPSS